MVILLILGEKQETMKKYARYAIFRTRLGWFGLCGDDRGLIRTCLPAVSKEIIRCTLLSGLDSPYLDPGYFGPVQNNIKSYFECTYADFRSVPVRLDGLTDFQRKVLLKLRNVRYGETISYADLAKMAGRTGAVRAIGQVMAKNPLPLIIPCHRVVRKDGSLGGFSAVGGVKMKKKMLNLELSFVPKGRIPNAETRKAIEEAEKGICIENSMVRSFQK